MAQNFLVIMYSTSKKFKVIGYTDIDNGGNIDEKKRTYGYTFHFGTGLVSWDSKKQSIVTMSSVEAEYVAAISVARQVVWMSRFLKDRSQNQQQTKTICYDNNTSISLPKEPCVPQENQAHQHNFSFHKRIGKQTKKLFYNFACLKINLQTSLQNHCKWIHFSMYIVILER